MKPLRNCRLSSSLVWKTVNGCVLIEVREGKKGAHIPPFLSDASPEFLEALAEACLDAAKYLRDDLLGSADENLSPYSTDELEVAEEPDTGPEPEPVVSKEVRRQGGVSMLPAQRKNHFPTGGYSE